MPLTFLRLEGGAQFGYVFPEHLAKQDRAPQMCPRNPVPLPHPNGLAGDLKMFLEDIGTDAVKSGGVGMKFVHGRQIGLLGGQMQSVK